MSPPTGPVTHVIFDYDGLLIDTESLYTAANTMMLARYDIEFTMELKRKMMGKKHMDAIQWLLDEVGINKKVTAEEYAKDYDEWLDKAYVTSEALPGAKKLVEHLHKHNVPMAICTGSCSRTFALKDTLLREFTYLIPIQIYTGDDPNVKNGKPHPEPYIYTASKFSPIPVSLSNVLVFEDAPNGVESALAAGMQCIAIPDPRVFQPDPVFRSRINRCLSSLEDFIPEEFGVSFF